MPLTPRGHSGRFVKAASAAAKKSQQQGPNIRTYFAPLHPAHHSSPLPARSHLPSSDASPPYPQAEIPDSIGRPPTKLALQPGDLLQGTTNGVISVVHVSGHDLEAASKVSTETIPQLLDEEPQKPSPSKGATEKRTLRSKDASSRVTSELVRFFPDYEETVFGLPKEPDFLTTDSVLYIIDRKQKVPEQPVVSTSGTHVDAEGIIHIADSQEDGTPFDALDNSPIPPRAQPELVDLSAFEGEAAKFLVDPLSDSVYDKPHKRAERKEKQLRNIEKEHALHEKAELERLLGELRGSEWLRTMGLTSVPEAERKKYMVHRDSFIERAEALLGKFSAWKEQEKELRAKKEEALAFRDGGDGESLSSNPSEHDPSAKQLQREARSAGPTVKKITLKLTKPATPPEPEKPFTSFFSRPHLKAAMATKRRRESVQAFGVVFPELAEKDFALPVDFVSKEALIANSRKRRRLKRESQGTALVE